MNGPDDPMDPVAEYGQMPGIVELLDEHSGGEAARLISEKLAELLTAVRATEKAGTLTIKLTAEPMNGVMASISIDATAKIPRETPPLDVLYIDDTGRAARHDPRQLRLTAIDFTAPRARKTTDLTGGTK